ncbi:MAG TPA: lipocalin family protein [Ignavibacteriales bacterium]|nr:lipocalin family protein [Ignavibacteriales bacterium]
MLLRYKAILVFFLVLISVALYSGCKKSDSNPTSPVAQASPIVGKWALSGVTVTNQDGSKLTLTPQQMGLSITMEFRNDNTATITTIDSTGTTTENGSYTYSNGVLDLTDTNGQKQTINVTISGNKITTEQQLTDDNGNPFNAQLEFTKQ